MAGELRAITGRPGRTCYFLIFDRTSQVWNGSSFVAYSTGDYANYDIPATEVGTSLGMYKANFPSTITAGVYDVVLKEQSGGSPAEGDTLIAVQDALQWSGTVTLPLSDLATSGQLATAIPIQVPRGVAQARWPLTFKSAADHITLFTSGVGSGQISRDGGAYGPLQSGNITEIGLGDYYVNLTSGDLNANVVRLHFSMVGVSGGQADPLKFALILQRTSGSL